MDRYNIEFYPESCCDLCHEIVHNHFDCPICNTKFAPTSIYMDAFDETEFECEKCKTKFKLVDKENNLWENI